MTRALPLVGLLALASPALALPEGRFVAEGEGATGLVAVEGSSFAIEVATDGCVGEGTGSWEETGPGAVLVTLDPPDPALGACTIAVTEAGDGTYRMVEDGCLGYHGAACGFSGSFDPAVPAPPLE